jgi:hypothetical protein
MDWPRFRETAKVILRGNPTALTLSLRLLITHRCARPRRPCGLLGLLPDRELHVCDKLRTLQDYGSAGPPFHFFIFDALRRQ